MQVMVAAGLNPGEALAMKPHGPPMHQSDLSSQHQQPQVILEHTPAPAPRPLPASAPSSAAYVTPAGSRSTARSFVWDDDQSVGGDESVAFPATVADASNSAPLSPPLGSDSHAMYQQQGGPAPCSGSGNLEEEEGSLFTPPPAHSAAAEWEVTEGPAGGVPQQQPQQSAMRSSSYSAKGVSPDDESEASPTLMTAPAVAAPKAIAAAGSTGGTSASFGRGGSLAASAAEIIERARRACAALKAGDSPEAGGAGGTPAEGVRRGRPSSSSLALQQQGGGALSGLMATPSASSAGGATASRLALAFGTPSGGTAGSGAFRHRSAAGGGFRSSMAAGGSGDSSEDEEDDDEDGGGRSSSDDEEGDGAAAPSYSREGVDCGQCVSVAASECVFAHKMLGLIHVPLLLSFETLSRCLPHCRPAATAASPFSWGLHLRPSSSSRIPLPPLQRQQLTLQLGPPPS